MTRVSGITFFAAKPFSTVEHTVYSFNGSRHAFYEWLQREAPEVP